MNNPIKKISPALFGLILICFFLPFTTISCQNQPVLSLTGVQLATGTSIEQPNPFGGAAKKQEIPGNPLASIAFGSACAGLATSFVVSKKMAIIPSGIGAVGSVVLLLLKTKLDDEILRQGQGALRVEYGLGFWMSFLLFLSAALLNGYLFLESKKTRVF